MESASRASEEGNTAGEGRRRGDEGWGKEEDKHTDHNPRDDMEGFNVVAHTAMRQINLEARQSRRDVS
jgi:hypothetical protein